MGQYSPGHGAEWGAVGGRLVRDERTSAERTVALEDDWFLIHHGSCHERKIVTRSTLRLVPVSAVDRVPAGHP
jgi:hypothetical protein